MTATYAQWFASASQDEDFFLEPSEHSTLQSYFEGNFSLQDAVSRLTGPSKPQWNSHQASQVWEVLLTLAEDYDEAHDDIISLIKALLSQSDAKGRADEEMYGFPFCWRAHHDSLWAQECNIKSFSDPVGSKWVTYQAFTARLIASSLVGAYGWVLFHTVDALEKPVNPEKLTARQDVDIAAAAQYFIYAANDILHHPLGSNGYDENNVNVLWQEGNEFWEGEQGFTVERWEFWKKRFGQVRDLEQLRDGTREAARRAEVGMEKAERIGTKKGRR
ncbi:hypothetical protein BDV23DRAFT_187249 [Aspergillus alliaceus]|uniref:Uncharacterized protein n=1 Tax=Petromyces alliaceus TaxID=209559 RepID=A0A5N7BX93_PETAA|nr:hypothetical protein BDV23DRAFT_187249 [Aspergillus alliaceus]